MIEELRFNDDDVIAIIAPHPDDECLGAAAALITAPEKTDVYVLSDGSHGGKDVSIEEEAVIRKRQFDAEMAYVKPHGSYWLGYEDTTLPKHYEAADEIDFSKYTKVFLPWNESLHPDHRAACELCCKAIQKQKVEPECYIYEVNAPFYKPTHYIDITGIADEKRKLIDFHEDQVGQKDMTLALNRFRAAQMMSKPAVEYAECYLKVNPNEIAYNEDLLVKLFYFKEDYSLYDRLEEKGIRIKRAISCDITPIQKFIEENFSKSWADEALPAIINGSCFIAVQGTKIVAFGCADATANAYIGPCGTAKEARGMGLYRALAQRCYRYLIEQGYRYGIVGMAAPTVLGIHRDLGDAMVIERSRGAYDDLLIRDRYHY